MMQQELRLLSAQTMKPIVKMEILLTSSKGYKQFAMEASAEVYPQTVQGCCGSEVIEQFQ